MNPDLKQILNRSVSMRRVLKQVYGVDAGNSSFNCPFPDHGSVDNTPSAQMFDATNSVYCYAEERVYSVYDALSASGKTDNELVAFVVNSLGGQAISYASKDDKTLDDYQAGISSYIEGCFARYRRGEMSWADLLPTVAAYFDNIKEES